MAADLFRDTIFALSSGRLPAGVAVVRLSGPHVQAVLLALFDRLPEPRRAVYDTVKTPGGEVIDQGLAMYFPAPRSFTGEDCAEFHVHGSRAVVSLLLRVIGDLDGLRHAEAGEFTHRAFLNGKLDLTGVEALADLVAAETDSQRRLAISNACGGQRALYGMWREQLLHARAMIEAEIDFSDEEDVPGAISDQIWTSLGHLQHEIQGHIAGFSRAEIIRDGFEVVLIGAPNAGKSSLLNALARREVAIVSDEPGTTRDLVEVSLDLGGMKVNVTDTAGLRAKAGKVEALGIDRALERARRAHLVLLLEDLSDPQIIDVELDCSEILRIGTKSDLSTAPAGHVYDYVVSSKDGSGVSILLARLMELAATATQGKEEILPARIRHIQHLQDCSAQISSAVSATQAIELRAEYLRRASDSLGRITGMVQVEELLDVIFAEFCIGK